MESSHLLAWRYPCSKHAVAGSDHPSGQLPLNPLCSKMMALCSPRKRCSVWHRRTQTRCAVGRRGRCESPPFCPIYLTRRKRGHASRDLGDHLGLVPTLTAEGQPKPHSRLVTRPGLEPGPGLARWRGTSKLGSRRERSRWVTFAGTGIRLYRGNLGSVLLKRLRKERNHREKDKRELAKEEKKKKGVPRLTHFLTGETHVLPGYHSGTCSAAYGKAVKVQVERLGF